jgi:glycosyltransferase involved in cell wall biosynthesis
MDKERPLSESSVEYCESAQPPFVSFLLVAYNQGKYIREAVLGAFSQTYPYLELIISDDCSSDDTFSIIEKEYHNYKGKHKVLINRMPTNVGLTAHLNAVVKLSQHRLLVLAAGDDISVPERVQKIVDRWRETNWSTGSIYSEYNAITERGNILARGGKTPSRSATSWVNFSNTDGKDSELLQSFPGATHACTREIFEFFGGLPENLIQEDLCLQLRSQLIGGVGFVCEPLIFYRITRRSQSRNLTGGLLGGFHRISSELRYLRSYLLVLENFLEELEFAVEKNMVPVAVVERTKHLAAEKVARIRSKESYLECGFFGRVRISLQWKGPLREKMRFLVYSVCPFLYGSSIYLSHWYKNLNAFNQK